jgi:hypothetical protein
MMRKIGLAAALSVHLWAVAVFVGPDLALLAATMLSASPPLY